MTDSSSSTSTSTTPPPAVPDAGDGARVTPPDTYARVLFTNDSLPAATGSILPCFHKAALADQRKHALEFFSFLDSDPNPLRMNIGTTLLTALAIIPNTSRVKVLYGLGFSAAAIGDSTPLDNKFLALNGDGNKDLGPPDILVLPASITTKEEVINPSDDLIQDSLTAQGATFGNHLLAPRTVPPGSKLSLLKIAPIPAYFVYDGFDGDLNAADVYERIMDSAATDAMMAHARGFLRSALVGRYRSTDTKPFVSGTEWRTMVPIAAKAWRKERLPALFPSVFLPVVQPPTIDLATPSATETTSKLLLELLSTLRSTPATISPESSPGKAEDTTPKSSLFERELLKKLCGQRTDADDALLPAWYQQLFQKHQDKKDKDHIVAALLSKPGRFEDDDIPIYPSLKKMILERNWVGGEAGGKPKLAYACHGITPFAMLDLTDDQIADMEFTQAYLAASSSTTPADIKASTTRLIATVPKEGAKWLQVIRRFANLLFLLFTPSCPLYIKLLDMVKALRAYPVEVIEKLPSHPKASILWIIHLQARAFAQGAMTPISATEARCLPAFSMMYNQCCATAIHTISVAGLPATLEHKKRPASPSPSPTGDDKPKRPKASKDEDKAKRPALPSGDPWHPLLKEKLGPALKTAKFPGISQIKEYCGLPQTDPVLPDAKAGDCRHYILLGSCKHRGACKFKHATATNDQTAVILQSLEKFVASPDGLRSEQNQK